MPILVDPVTIPQQPAKSFPARWIYNLIAHSPAIGQGSLRIELLPFNGTELGPASEMKTFNSSELFAVLHPETGCAAAIAAFDAIQAAIPALLAWQEARASLASRP